MGDKHRSNLFICNTGKGLKHVGHENEQKYCLRKHRYGLE